MSKRGLIGLASVWASVVLLVVGGVLYPKVVMIIMGGVLASLVVGIFSYLFYKMFE